MKYKVTLNGKTYEVEVEETDAVITDVAQEVLQAPAATAPTPAPVQQAAPASPQLNTTGVKVLAPMPGIILSLNVVTGQTVKAGDTLLVLEAMKMENEILAPESGTLVAVYVSQGASIQSGDKLFTVA